MSFHKTVPDLPPFILKIVFYFLKPSVIFFYAPNRENSTSFDEDACCDRQKTSAEDGDCGCPNNKLFREHKIYSGYRDAKLKLPLGYCPGWELFFLCETHCGIPDDAVQDFDLYKMQK